MTREERSIALLKICEPTNGYHLAFSGGKDSQVLYHLCKNANIKFTAYFCRTSVDPPEIISFIKENYKDVIILNPKFTMYQLILRNKLLPTKLMKFCCRYLKEYAGEGELVLTGIRSAESVKRSLRPEIELDHEKLKVFLHPIKKWSDAQIWKYLKIHKIKVNELYSQGLNRIGCIGCPCSTRTDIIKSFQKYPQHRIAYINTIKKLMQDGKYSDFEDAEDVFEWWISDKSKKLYMQNKNQMQINLK